MSTFNLRGNILFGLFIALFIVDLELINAQNQRFNGRARFPAFGRQPRLGFPRRTIQGRQRLLRPPQGQTFPDENNDLEGGMPSSDWFGSQFRGRGPRSRVTSRTQRNPAVRRPFTGQQNVGPRRFNFRQSAASFTRHSPDGSLFTGQRGLGPRQFDFRRGATSFMGNLQQRQATQRFPHLRQGSLMHQTRQPVQTPNQEFQTSFRPRDVVLREVHQPHHTSRVLRVPVSEQRLTHQQFTRARRINPQTVRHGFVNRITGQRQAAVNSHMQGHGQWQSHAHVPRVNGLHTNIRHSGASTSRMQAGEPTSGVEHIGNVAVVRTKSVELPRHVAKTTFASQRPSNNHHQIFVRPIQRQAVVVQNHPESHSRMTTSKHVPVVQKAGLPVAVHAQGFQNKFRGQPKVVLNRPVASQSKVASNNPKQIQPKFHVVNTKLVHPVVTVPAKSGVQTNSRSASANIPAVAIVPVIETQPSKTVSTSVNVETQVTASEPVAVKAPSVAKVPAAASNPASKEPTLEEDLQLIQSVIDLLQTAGSPSAISGIPQAPAPPVPNVASNFGVNQFGSPFWPGSMSPWAGSFGPAFMSELLFGDTTDPPDPIPTTTVAPNVTAVNATESALNVTTVTIVAKEPAPEQIPAPQSTTPTPEILGTETVPAVELLAFAEQPVTSTTIIPETVAVKAEVKTEINVDTSNGDKVQTLSLEPLPDTTTKLKGQVIDVVVGELAPKAVDSGAVPPKAESLNLIKIITDALKAASYPAALQEKLLNKLSSVVSQTRIKTESNLINGITTEKMMVLNQSTIQTKPRLSVTDNSNQNVKVSKESTIDIKSNNVIGDSSTAKVQISKEIKREPTLAIADKPNEKLTIKIEANNAVGESNTTELQVSNEAIIKTESKSTKAGANIVKHKVSKESSMNIEIKNSADSIIQPVDNLVDKNVPKVPNEVEVVTQIPIDLSIRTDRLPTAADLGVVINYNPIVETTKTPAIKIKKNPIQELIKDKVLALVRRISNKRRAQLPNVVVVKQAPVTVVTKDNTLKDKRVIHDLNTHKFVKSESKPSKVEAADKILINDISVDNMNVNKADTSVKVIAAVDLTNSEINIKMPVNSKQTDKAANEVTYTIINATKDTTEQTKKIDINKTAMPVDNIFVATPNDLPVVSDLNARTDIDINVIINDSSVADKSLKQVIQKTDNMNVIVVKEPSIELVLGNHKIDSVDPTKIVDNQTLKDIVSVTNDSTLNLDMLHNTSSVDRSTNATINILPETPKPAEVMTNTIESIDHTLTDISLNNGITNDNNIIGIFDFTSNADASAQANTRNAFLENNASAVHQVKDIPIFMMDPLIKQTRNPVPHQAETAVKPTDDTKTVSTNLNDKHILNVTNSKVENLNKEVYVSSTQPLLDSNQTIQSVISSEGVISEPAYTIDPVSMADTADISVNIKTGDKLVPLMPDKEHNYTSSQIVEGIPVGHITDKTPIDTIELMNTNSKDITSTVEAIAKAGGKPALEIVLESLAGQTGLGPGVQFLSRPISAVDPAIINQLTAAPKLSGVDAPEVKRQFIEPKKQSNAEVHVTMRPEVLRAKIKPSNVNGTEINNIILDVNKTKSPHISNDSVLNNIDLASLAKELKLISNGTDITGYLSDPLFVSVLEDIVNQTLSGAAGATTDLTSTEVPINTEMTSTEIPFETTTEPFMTTTEEPPEIEIEDITTTSVPTTTAPTTTVKPTKKTKRKRPLRRKWKRRRLNG